MKCLLGELSTSVLCKLIHLSFFGMISSIPILCEGQRIEADSLVEQLASMPNDTNKIITLNDIAFVYYTIDTDSAELFINDALRLSQQLDYKRGIALSYLRLGTVKLIRGDIIGGIDYFEQSIILANAVPDHDIASRAILNMGNVHLDLDDNSKALEYFQKAKVGFEKVNDVPMICNAEMTLGLIYRGQNKLDEAEACFLKSISYGQEQHPYYGQVLYELAELRIKQQRFIEADSLLSLSYDFLKDSKNVLNKGGVERVYSKYYLSINDLPRAMQHAKAAIEYLIQSHHITELEETYQIMSDIEIRQNNPKKAFEYLRKHVLYRDSIHSAVTLERARLFEKEEKGRLKSIEESTRKLELAQKRNQQNIFGASVILFLVIVTGLIFSIRQKQGINKKLVGINKEISTKNNELSIAKKDLTALNYELKRSQDALQASNEELKQQQEEISTQLDAIAMQNEKLNKANAIIEEQNKTISDENNRLEKAVLDRTKELTEYTNQLEQYTFVTAHSLRAPVARVLGLGKLLELKKSDEAEREEVIKHIIDVTQELDKVIHDLNQILESKPNGSDS